jgi:TPR repeat protein
MNRLFVTLIFFLSPVAPTLASELDLAMAAFDARRFDVAVALLSPLADAGEAKAQVVLAEIHAHGLGRPKDGQAALAWILRAANQGDMTAQAITAGYYLQGIGTKPDHAQGLHWFSLAAAQGHSAASHNVGTMTLHGIGTEPDRGAAEGYLLEAAALGEADSHFLLGKLYFADALTTGNIDPALTSFVDAALLGHRQAMTELAILLDELPEVPHHRVKAAFQYRTAILAGCTDLDAPSQRAMSRLTKADAEVVESELTRWLPHLIPAIERRKEQPGPCLAPAGEPGITLLVQAAFGPT